MLLFEWVVAILFGAVILTGVARSIGVPYPSSLALGGAALALVPGAPHLVLEPDLALVLFVAPVLVDAAYDTSLRDLRANWLPVAGLVLGAVGLNTAVVAIVAHFLVPGIPWAAAIALGAVVAPPDITAASPVLRQLKVPHRLLTILEGEGLFNDAMALLILRLATSAALAGTFSPLEIVPTFLLGVAGSLVAGPVLGWLFVRYGQRVNDVASAIVLQFVGAFGVWLLAERLGLSGVLTVVGFGLTIGRLAPGRTPARQRLPTYAVWGTAVFVLNVVAFVLIGLQIGPLVTDLAPDQLGRFATVAGAVVATVFLVRFGWVMGYVVIARLLRRDGAPETSFRPGLLVSWCGMRGVVTLAAAFSLPGEFPHRDLVLVAAFSVVLGTLAIQGLSLRWLLGWLHLEDDDPVAHEVGRARRLVLEAALQGLGDARSAAAGALRQEYEALLDQAKDAPEGEVTAGSEHDRLRRQAVGSARECLFRLRRGGEIGDDAFHVVEAELDRIEMSVR